MMVSPIQAEDTIFTRTAGLEPRALHRAAGDIHAVTPAEPLKYSRPYEADEERDISFGEDAALLADVPPAGTTGRTVVGGTNRSKKDKSSCKDVLSLVEIQKTTEGFGFNIIGGVDNPHFPEDAGIFVSLVNPQSPAFGVVRAGDKILSINGIDLTHKTHDEAVELFRSMNLGRFAKMLIDREAYKVHSVKSKKSKTSQDSAASSNSFTPGIATQKKLNIIGSSLSEGGSDSKNKADHHGVGTVVERVREKKVRTANGSVLDEDEDGRSFTSYAPSMHSIIDDVPRTPRRPFSLLDPRNNTVFTEVLYVGIGLAAISLGGFLVYRFIRSRH
ncbi:unnamed protein product [Caenorhabditis auriculariae]|uniref:PDZ domain-containing protein n=1 Tax=Caenorhabditis auriculariae TaxID=2777116 RepID=A0A8S1HGK1_9PELO|nr:unnamed protein product [Caenorhabditis auriculariae]